MIGFFIGGIPLPIFSEWWLAKEKFSTIEAFIISLFPGATCQGCNGLSIKYQVNPCEALEYLLHLDIVLAQRIRRVTICSTLTTWLL